jgi:heptaprenylglyceryl phosphate synthase
VGSSVGTLKRMLAMELESILLLISPYTMVNGEIIPLVEKVFFIGQMDLCTMVTGRTASATAWASSLLQMDSCTMECGSTMPWKVKEEQSIQMVNNMMEIG